MKKLASLENINKCFPIGEVKAPKDLLSFGDEIGFFKRVGAQRVQNMNHSLSGEQFKQAFKNFLNHPFYADALFQKYFPNAKKVDNFFLVLPYEKRPIFFDRDRKMMYICKLYKTSDKKDKKKKIMYVRVGRKLILPDNIFEKCE